MGAAPVLFLSLMLEAALSRAPQGKTIAAPDWIARKVCARLCCRKATTLANFSWPSTWYIPGSFVCILALR